MPLNNDFRCDPLVNNAVKNLHKKCCNNRHSYKVLGKHLHLLPEINNVFDAKKHYVVCHQIYRQNILPNEQKVKNDGDNNN